MSEELQWYTTDEVAKMIGIVPETVRDWIRDKKLNAKKLGREWRVSTADIKELMS